MRWLETVALGVYVYDLTQDAFLVGFVGFLRMAPMLFLGAFIGALADRVNRRAILATANITLSVVYLDSRIPDPIRPHRALARLSGSIYRRCRMGHRLPSPTSHDRRHRPC